jgi:hypothetical protein
MRRTRLLESLTKKALPLVAYIRGRWRAATTCKNAGCFTVHVDSHQIVFLTH